MKKRAPVTWKIGGKVIGEIVNLDVSSEEYGHSVVMADLHLSKEGFKLVKQALSRNKKRHS